MSLQYFDTNVFEYVVDKIFVRLKPNILLIV